MIYIKKLNVWQKYNKKNMFGVSNNEWNMHDKFGVNFLSDGGSTILDESCDGDDGGTALGPIHDCV